VQLLEGVLDHVLGGGHVSGHQQGEPDQIQVMGAEQVGHRRRGDLGTARPVHLAGGAGQPRSHS
jgi:hypothetical protein